MERFFVYATVALVLIILSSFYRVLRGPTVFDRLLAVGAMGSKSIGLVCLFGILYGRLDLFLDIALGYAILNFIGIVAVSQYFQISNRTE